MLITDAVMAMKGADKAKYGVEVRKMYLAAIEVQQKSAHTAQSLSVAQFVSRMSRAVKSYQTAFQNKQLGIEFRKAMTSNSELWKGILDEMSAATDLFAEMAQRPDLHDVPIGTGITFPDWRLMVETGRVVTRGASPRTEPHIGGIAELMGLSWTFAEEHMDIEDLLNTTNFARLEFRGANERPREITMPS